MQNNALLEGERVAKVSIFRLLLLGMLKLTVGLFTGLTVIIADSISTFADTLGVFASYIGLRLSRKTADEHFKYGYYKIETFAALLISLGIIYVGSLILIRSIDTFNLAPTGQHRIYAIFMTIMAIISSYFLFKSLKKAGDAANSLSLIASAQDKKWMYLPGLQY